MQLPTDHFGILVKVAVDCLYLWHFHFLSLFLSPSLYSVSVLSSKKTIPTYRGIVIYPLQPTKVNFKVRPGYFPSIYFWAVRFRLSEAEHHWTTVPSVSVTFQIFFSTIRGRLPMKSLIWVAVCIFLSLSFFLSFLLFISTFYIQNFTCQEKKIIFLPNPNRRLLRHSVPSIVGTTPNRRYRPQSQLHNNLKSSFFYSLSFQSFYIYYRPLQEKKLEKKKKFFGTVFAGALPLLWGVFLFFAAIENQSQKTPGGPHTIPTPIYNWPV